MGNISTIPFGTSFLDALAAGILDQYGQNGLDLSDIRVLLPTRRACRMLQSRFLAMSENRSLILPRLSAIGDVDADELDIWLTAEIAPNEIENIPSAINPLERIFLLSSLIGQRADFKNQPARAFALAQDLAQLMDSVIIENLSFNALDKIVPEDFAHHWQITTHFLSILWQEWPKILTEKGVIEAADRRNRLLIQLADYWGRNPPSSPVIAAGITGTIPATINILQTLQHTPKGHIVLPGLDCELDDESWNDLSATHPQFTLKALLEKLNIDRKAVHPWRIAPKIDGPTSKASHQNNIQAREKLLREVMRPTQTALTWQHLSPDELRPSLNGLSLLEAQTAQEEARAIALLMRETLELDGKTAALVTPDPALAKRVTGELARWGITVDNTAGRPASESTLGNFLLRMLRAIQDGFTPITLLGLLKHKLSAPENNDQWQKDLSDLDLCLRGTKPEKGFSGILGILKRKDRFDIYNILESYAEKFIGFDALMTGTHQFSDFATIHLDVAQSLGDIWAAEGAKEIADMFHGILNRTQALRPVTFHDYCEIIQHILAATPVRTILQGHPRLFILGQIEARILQCDRMVLSGLNESTWPAQTKADPWMSRPMRQNFGLPSAEIDTGLSALDFTLSCGAPEVILTRAKRDGDAPTVASRWWQRLEVVLTAAHITLKDVQHPYIHWWIRQLDCFENEMRTITAPEPRPPLAARPRKLSVTQIETLMRDPYAIYARMILGLRPLDALEEPLSEKDRGTWLHEILNDFTKRNPTEIPDNAIVVMMQALENKFVESGLDALQKSFWCPRLQRALNWFIAHEKEWRKNAQIILCEERKKIVLDCDGHDFTLEAKPDRIDKFKDGSLAIIDYKSSAPATTKNTIINGLTPQLPLEALIAARGGITAQPENPSYLGYWVLNGSNDNEGEEKQIDIANDMDIFLDETEKGLKSVIVAFDNENTPYHSIPNPKQQPKAAHQNYRHLARVAEWSVIDAESDE